MTTKAVETNTEPIATKERENEVEISDKFDIVGHLPAEIVQQIFFDLSPEDLNSATSCCSSWSAAVSDDYFWKKLCERDGHLEVEESERSEFYNNFLTKYNYWQAVYWYNYTLQRNWETNNYREYICERKQSGACPLGLWNFGDVIAFAEAETDGLKMYIYDIKRKQETVYEIPTDCWEPMNLLRSGNYLIAVVPGDNGMILWNFVNGTTILEFDETVWYDMSNVYVDKHLILLETYNQEFKVFNIDSRKIEYKYTGNFKYLIMKDGKIIFSTGDDINMLKWNNKSIVTLPCCQSLFYRKLMIKNDLLFSFCDVCLSFDRSLCIWNTTTNTKLHSVFLGPRHNLCSISFINKYLYVSRYNDDESNYELEFWDYMKGTPKVAMVAKSDQYINCSSNDHFMLPSNCLKIWCLRTRNFISISDVAPAPDDQYEIELSKTKLTFVLRSTNEEPNSDTITIHQRDYEI